MPAPVRPQPGRVSWDQIARLDMALRLELSHYMGKPRCACGGVTSPPPLDLILTTRQQLSLGAHRTSNGPRVHVFFPLMQACVLQFAHVWLLAEALMQACIVLKAGPIQVTGLASVPDLVIRSNADLHKLIRHTKMIFNLPCLYRPLIEHGGDCMQHNVSNQT